MLLGLLKSIARFFGFCKDESQQSPKKYALKEFESRSDAVKAAINPGVAALVRGSKGYKWILMQCPCGCKQQIALNLMQSHSPHWRVEIQSHDLFSIHPSIDSTTCGAHFWVRNGQVIWCQ